MFGVDKTLPEYEFSDLMNNWLDSATREEVERSARRRTPLPNREHAALAAEFAARRVAAFWWLVPVVAVQAGLVIAMFVAKQSEDRTGWDVAYGAVVVSMLIYATAYTVTYVRAFRFHRPDADYEALQARARVRRSRQIGA